MKILFPVKLYLGNPVYRNIVLLDTLYMYFFLIPFETINQFYPFYNSPFYLSFRSEVRKLSFKQARSFYKPSGQAKMKLSMVGVKCMREQNSLSQTTMSPRWIIMELRRQDKGGRVVLVVVVMIRGCGTRELLRLLLSLLLRMHL